MPFQISPENQIVFDELKQSAEKFDRDLTELRQQTSELAALRAQSAQQHRQQQHHRQQPAASPAAPMEPPKDSREAWDRVAQLRSQQGR